MSTPSYLIAHRVLPLQAGTKPAALWEELSGPGWSMWLATIGQTLEVAVRGIGVEGAASGEAVIERDGIEMIAVYFPKPAAAGEPYFAIVARAVGGEVPLRSFVFEMGVTSAEEPVRVVMAEWKFTDVDNGVRVRFAATGDASLAACVVRVVAEMATAREPAARRGPIDRAKLLPKLRHHRWMGWTELPGRPLLAMPIANLPHVAVGVDSRERFEIVRPENLGDVTTFEELEALAVANLSRRAEFWNMKEKSKGFLGIGAKPVVLELVSEHACERILDPVFLHKAHDQLKTPLLAVAIPARGILVCRDGKGSVADLGDFVALARTMFTGVPKGLEPITPLVFAVMAGKVTGTIAGSGDDAKAEIEPERGFPWPVQPVRPAQPA